MYIHIYIHTRTGPLVTECAKGLESACDELAKDPAALNALKTMDSSNPSGYAATHARAPAAYTPSVPAAQTVSNTYAYIMCVCVCIYIYIYAVYKISVPALQCVSNMYLCSLQN